MRYEEILGNEEESFRQLFDFWRLSPLEKALARVFVRRYALRKRAGDPHVRNPSSGQWRRQFTPRVKDAFDAQYGELIERLGYPAD